MADAYVITVNVDEYLYGSGTLILTLVGAGLENPDQTKMIYHETEKIQLAISDPVCLGQPGIVLVSQRPDQEIQEIPLEDCETDDRFCLEICLMMIQKIMGGQVSLKKTADLYCEETGDIWANDVPYQTFNAGTEQKIVLFLKLEVSDEQAVLLVKKLLAWLINLTKSQIQKHRNNLLAGIFGQKNR